MDDLIIHSPDFSFTAPGRGVEKIGAAGPPAAVSNLSQQQLKFLGHVVDRNGLKPDPENLPAARVRSVPTTVRQLQAFVGPFYASHVKFCLSCTSLEPAPDGH